MANLQSIIKNARNYLEEDEKVVAAIRGKYEKEHHGEERVSFRSGGLLATSRRLVFYAPKWFTHEMEIFPYNNISSIESGSRILWGQYIHIIASGNKLKMKRVKEGDTSKFINYVRNRIEGRKQGGDNSKPDKKKESPTDKLEKLGNLKDRGVISEDEFQEKKQELLDKI